MTKEELTSKIKLEYDLYMVNDVYDIEDVLSFIKNACNVTEARIVRLNAEKSKNKFDKLISIVLGQRRLEFDYVDPKEYDEDNELANLQIEMANGYLYYFGRLCDVLNSGNVKEVYRLASFTAAKYRDNDIAVGRTRMLKRCQATGFFAIINDMPMDYLGFPDFFDSVMKEFGHIDNQQFFKK